MIFCMLLMSDQNEAMDFRVENMTREAIYTQKNTMAHLDLSSYTTGL